MSMNSEKQASAPKADALAILKCWERGELNARVLPTKEVEALNQQQMRRLWSLLQSPSTQGVISYQLPR